MLAGEDIIELQSRFPVAQRLMEIVIERAEPDADFDEIRFKVARLITTALGWLMVEPFILQALEISESTEELRWRLVLERAKDLNFPT